MTNSAQSTFKVLINMLEYSLNVLGQYFRISFKISHYVIFSYVRILLLVSLGCILASKALGMTNVARSTFKVLMNGPNDKQSCWPTLMIGPIDQYSVCHPDQVRTVRRHCTVVGRLGGKIINFAVFFQLAALPPCRADLWDPKLITERASKF